MIRRILTGAFALLLSALLIISIPLINYLLEGGAIGKKEKTITSIQLKRINMEKPKPKPQKKLRRPERRKPTRTQLKAGPRFAMDLGVAGSGGVAVDMALLAERGQGGSENEGVDELPTASFRVEPVIPEAVREKEVNVFVMASFCVDAGGRAFDIRIVEEKPPGLGMGNACREALRNTTFQAARKGGAAVPFCGLEQPFEVKFDD